MKKVYSVYLVYLVRLIIERSRAAQQSRLFTAIWYCAGTAALGHTASPQ